MRRMIVTSLFIISLWLPLTNLSLAQDTSDVVYTPSGRFALSIPETWITRLLPDEEELGGLDSETIVLATSYDAIDDYLGNVFFDGTIIFVSAYPYHVFEPDVLGDSVAMLADVTVFPENDLEAKSFGGFSGAQYYRAEEGEFFITENLADTGEMAYRMTIYSTRPDDYDLSEAILDSITVERPTLDSLLQLDTPTETITTEDDRLSFAIPEQWLYWLEGDNSISFATTGEAYADVSYSFMPQASTEVVFTVQRFIKSGLRAGEVLPDGNADLAGIAKRLRIENGGLAKDQPAAPYPQDGVTVLDTEWLVTGDTQTIRTQTRLLDAGDVVYIIQAQYADVALKANVDAIFASMRYTAPPDLLDTNSVGVEIGQRAPDFITNILDGETVNLSDYQGRVVLVNMWATWCGPCHREAPAMQELYDAYGGAFEILAVNVGETPVDARGFRSQYQLTFPILMDEQFEIAELYNLNAYPTTYVLAPDGVIIEKVRGSFSEQSLIDLLAVYVGRR